LSNPPDATPILICSICHKDVLLEAANTDENGDPVHERCYVSRLTAKTPQNDS
jgi:hypothetical protein